MHEPRCVAVGGICLLAYAGLLAGQALPSAHPECTFFGEQRDRFVKAALSAGSSRAIHPLSASTGQVTKMLGYVPGGSRTYNFDQAHQDGSIDSFIFADFEKNAITPASKTTDWEFIRRVTLDLTGRIPKPDRVLGFVADPAQDKRARLIDELLAAPEWVDKWTMFFGDLFQNTVNKPSTGVNRQAQGRNAFYQWIKDSLGGEKPYSQMASELIGSAAASNYDNGPVNFLVGGVVLGNGVPVQDTTDQMTANIAQTFLGMAHVNCLLCHNGRGHLDALNLWAAGATRYQAWQLASFLSHTQAARAGTVWSLQDETRGFTNDYALNTTTGNRPARVSPQGCKAGQPCYYVAPQYIFNGDPPKPGEKLRAALARNVTGDFQFARAAVNYVWAELFGRGIVDPPDTFDLARLDPDNPPPAPWTLQPSNARLLNALAQHFIDSGYSLKSLMREIANSDTYQLSSRYDGQWNAAWEPYFARKFVRRLWAEEIHDAVLESSGVVPSYTIAGFTDQGFPKPSHAMQFPDVVGGPDRNTNDFLDSFLRGNRDDQPRRRDGSILQALNLMNNTFVQARLQTAGSNPSQLIARNLSKSDEDLVTTLFLTVLSRYPSDDEKSKAKAALATGNRTQAVQDLVWTLYNKVDFIFNY